VVIFAKYWILFTSREEAEYSRDSELKHAVIVFVSKVRVREANNAASIHFTGIVNTPGMYHSVSRIFG
jgi:hypothetical protein